MASLPDALASRSGGQCELCESTADLTVHTVAASPADSDADIVVCAICAPQLAPDATLDALHWRCLQGAIWSTTPAAQALAWRLLKRLDAEDWARDIAEQAYLEEDVLAWAEAGIEATEAEVRTLDCNGNVLNEGDSVTLIKDLDVKGTTFVAKRGTMVRNIHLIGDPDNIEGKVNKVSLILKTCFLKRA